MPLVKATDIAFARLQVPDMDVAEQFLLDFGLQRAERTATALYMRGDGSRSLHIRRPPWRRAEISLVSLARGK